MGGGGRHCLCVIITVSILDHFVADVGQATGDADSEQDARERSLKEVIALQNMRLSEEQRLHTECKQNLVQLKTAFTEELNDVEMKVPFTEMGQAGFAWCGYRCFVLPLLPCSVSSTASKLTAFLGMWKTSW
jgi:hypothetical protein